MRNIDFTIYAKDPVQSLRELREQTCFKVINRGKLWYDCLTPLQLSELKTWYHAWLNVTDTKVIPKTPSWLNDKVIDEEILL